MELQIFAPATIGNVGVGFDVLGAAVGPLAGAPWGDTVGVKSSQGLQFHAVGPWADRLPAPAHNLVLLAGQAVARSLRRDLDNVSITLHKGLPVGSGLGSSSASAVAGAVAVGAWLAGVAPDQVAAWKSSHQALLLEAAGQAEAIAAGAPHLDNVAPCLLGGLQLQTPHGHRPLSWPQAIGFVIVSPDYSVATQDARAVLPADVPRAVAIAHAQLLATTVLALHTADIPLLGAALRDVIAEPHRAALMPGFRAVQAAALQAGALACTLSGAGPAVFAIGPHAQLPAVATQMSAVFAASGHASTVRMGHLDGVGARAVTSLPAR